MAKKDKPKIAQPKFDYQQPSPPRVILAALEPTRPEAQAPQAKPLESPPEAPETLAPRDAAPEPQIGLTGLGSAGAAMAGTGVAGFPAIGPGSGVIATGAGFAPTAQTSGPRS
jgi:hypothetical protein